MKRTRISYKIRLIAVLLCLCMLLPLCACGESRETKRQISAMNTIMTLTAYGKKAEAGLNAAEGVIVSMDAALDPELPNSTVYSINHSQGQNVIVSAQVAKMLSSAMTVYTQSGGALDLSIYPLVKRWGFVDGKYYLPTDEEISAEAPPDPRPRRPTRSRRHSVPARRGARRAGCASSGAPRFARRS